MNWNSIVMNCRYSDPRRLALVMSEMWKAAAQYGSDALLSNLSINLLDSSGVAMQLDWSAVPVPAGLAARLGA